MSLYEIYWLCVAGIWLCLLAAAGYAFLGVRWAARKVRAFRRLQRRRNAYTAINRTRGMHEAWRRGLITDGDQ